GGSGRRGGGPEGRQRRDGRADEQRSPQHGLDPRSLAGAGQGRVATTISGMKIGVLAVQGNVREHAAMLRRLGADVVEVRKPEQLDGLDGLVVPGGESTTFMRLMRLYGLDEALRSFSGPVFGTCAGMIVLDPGPLAR